MNKSFEKALNNLRQQKFHKLIIGASIKDHDFIEKFSYLFSLAEADVLDISAFPLSVIAATKGIRQAYLKKNNLIKPLIMVSINIGSDPHFRRITLNESNCTECLLCIPSCPSQAFFVNEAQNFNYNIDLCFGCDNCLNYCHFDALHWETWDQYSIESLNDLQKLGANALEIHLNEDLDEFTNIYQKIPKTFLLESFCVGSKTSDEEVLKQAITRIIENYYIKHDRKKEFIIQVDGIPQSGAKTNSKDQDLVSINKALVVKGIIQKFFPEFEKQIFIQISGGINDNTFLKCKKKNLPIDGVAIGSFARRKIGQAKNSQEEVEIAENLLKF